ncbi:unnamed protein product [Symbiodinium natans]|uniref:Pentatricopeptide repeat-containing protein, chloroplastic n=1 Tax=Symbiodinium natans TaxID=878477 RepID=A0A812MHS0_9DINO|nr:unnamed protein product [Symbiodinium natans]
MQSAGVQPNVIHTNAAAKACARGSQWVLVLQLLRAADGIEPDVISYNTAIAACGPSGHWRPAVDLLAAARCHALATDVVSYTAALSSLEKGTFWSAALGAFRSLTEQMLEPTQISLNSALSAWARPNHWPSALRLLSAAAEKRIRPDTVSFATTSSSAPWQNAGGLLAALRVLGLRWEGMPNRGPWRLATACTTQADVDSAAFRAVVQACAAERSWEASVAMWRRAQQADLITHNSVLKSLEGHWVLAQFFLCSMKGAHLRPSAVTKSTMVSHMAGSRGWLQTMQLLSRSGSKTASIFSVNSAITTCSHELWHVAVRLVAQTYDSRMGPDTITYNSAVNVMEDAGQWQLAGCLMQEAIEVKLESTASSFRGAIAATTSRSLWRPALALWRHAEQVGLDGTRTAALQACQSAQRWQWALAAFSTLEAPSLRDCNCALSLCADSNSSPLALQVLRSMPLCQLRADVVSFNSAMGACGDGSWQLAAWLLQVMAATSLDRNAISFGSAIDSCGRFATWHAAVELCSRAARLGGFQFTVLMAEKRGEEGCHQEQ